MLYLFSRAARKTGLQHAASILPLQNSHLHRASETQEVGGETWCCVMHSFTYPHITSNGHRDSGVGAFNAETSVDVEPAKQILGLRKS